MPTSPNILPFRQRLAQSRPLVADGATGTNLQQRGLKPGTPPEVWLFERPEMIIGLHEDFLRAGADILLTCSFGANPLRLAETPLAGRAAEVNTRAVQLAQQAIAGLSDLGRPVYIAGSMGPIGQLLKPLGPLEPEQVQAAYAEQAQALVQAGVDLLVIETQFDLAEAGAALQGARQVSDLPVVLSFSYDRGTRTMMGVKPAQMAAHFNESQVDLLGINCGRSLEENFQALQELLRATEKLIWFKPNAGLPRSDGQGGSIYDVTPDQMGAAARQWLAAGERVRVIGGCCGTSPAHLAEIARSVRLA